MRQTMTDRAKSLETCIPVSKSCCEMSSRSCPISRSLQPSTIHPSCIMQFRLVSKRFVLCSKYGNFSIKMEYQHLTNHPSPYIKFLVSLVKSVLLIPPDEKDSDTIASQQGP